jgi:hypothetical protein
LRLQWVSEPGWAQNPDPGDSRKRTECRDGSDLKKFLLDFQRHFHPSLIEKALTSFKNGKISSIKLSSVPPELFHSKELLPPSVITGDE